MKVVLCRASTLGKMGKLRRIHLQLSPKQNKNMPITGKSRLRPCVGDSAVAVRSGLHLHPLHPFGSPGYPKTDWLGHEARPTREVGRPHEVAQADGAERTAAAVRGPAQTSPDPLRADLVFVINNVYRELLGRDAEAGACCTG